MLQNAMCNSTTSFFFLIFVFIDKFTTNNIFQILLNVQQYNKHYTKIMLLKNTVQ